MNFAEKLKAKRNEKGLSQKKLAEAAGISIRTLQNYELGKRYPANIEISSKLASLLDTDISYLLSDGEKDIVTAPLSAKRQLEKLVESVAGLFAGGEIGDEDRDAALQAIIDAYWAAKKENRKYAGNKKGSSKK